MIADNLRNSDTYADLGERIAIAFKYLKNNDFSKMDDGRYDIRGDEIFATVARYKTKAREEGRWEAHRKYIDIQFLAEGCELIGVTSAGELTVANEYSEKSDIMFFNDSDGDFCTLAQDRFILLFPQDAHMPCITDKTQSDVTKVVVKILV